MSHKIYWIKKVYRPLTRRAAQRVIAGRLRDRRSPEKGRFTRGDVDKLLNAAWLAYDQAAASLPDQPTIGSTMNVHLACFTLSVFKTFLGIGTEREYAIELVADATWRIYEVWARLGSLAARLVPWKSTALGFAATRKGDRKGIPSLNFPFNAPGYLIEPVVSTQGTAFDVVRCPVASYFREQGAADVCVASWCNLDYALGEMTNGKLVRTKTLVQGNDRCDFRILPITPRLKKDAAP